MAQIKSSPAGVRRADQALNAAQVLALLAAANMLNFYDRALPAILIEPIKAEFGFNDAHVGILSASFTVVYAAAGIWFGRLADKRARRVIMAWGLVVWSICTALTAGVWSFTSILLFRLGVGIGEASYAPAANSLIADLYPAAKRSRAVAIFQVGIPIGTILAFTTTGAIAEAFGTWRAPFLVAAIPGIVLALFLVRITEPRRGAADEGVVTPAPERHVWRSLLGLPTMRWLVVSGIGLNMAAYSVTTFLVPLLQRYHGLSLTSAALNAGMVIGVAALLGLVVGGIVCDRASRRSKSARVLVGGVCLLLAAPLAYVGFELGPDQIALFVVLLSLVSFLQFTFHTSALPAVSDVVAPHLRASAIGIFGAASYLLGGAFGPVITGVLSEALAATGDGVSASAHGLRLSLLIVTPLALLLAGIGLLGASRTVNGDHRRMIGSTNGQLVAD